MSKVEDIRPRNKDLIDNKDQPVEPVQRHDGLPTVTDLERLMGKKSESEESDESPNDKAASLKKFLEGILELL